MKNERKQVRMEMPREPGTVPYHFRDPGLKAVVEVWVKPESYKRLQEGVVVAGENY